MLLLGAVALAVAVAVAFAFAVVVAVAVATADATSEKASENIVLAMICLQPHFRVCVHRR